MALHYGQDWDGESVSYVRNSQVSSASATLECKIEPLLSYYPDIETVNFTNVASFKVICNGVYDGLVEGRGCPYLAFLDVSLGMFEAIDRLQVKKSCTIPRMSILYDKEGEILITKFKVGVSHEVVIGLFEDKLKEMYGPNYNSLVNTGTTRFGDLTRRSKEPNISFMPESRDMTSHWPSLVVEVGASESLINLQGDLKYWLRESNNKTRVAILLHINKTRGTILIERWEVVPCVRPARVNVNYGASVQMAQSILLHAQVVYNGSSLSIPADQLFDNVPATVKPGEFSLSAGDLDRFNNRFWNLLHMAARRY